MAHYAALDELSKLNTNTHQPVFLKDEENDSVEFEISDEVLDFYRKIWSIIFCAIFMGVRLFL